MRTNRSSEIRKEPDFVKAGKRTRATANQMTDEGFAALKHALEDALAYESGERRDLSVARIQCSLPPKLSLKLATRQKRKPAPAEAGAFENTSEA